MSNRPFKEDIHICCLAYPYMEYRNLHLRVPGGVQGWLRASVSHGISCLHIVEYDPIATFVSKQTIRGRYCLAHHACMATARV